MRDIAIVLIVAGALPMILARPHIGILVYSWISYMSPHRLTWGFAYDLPFAQVTSLATVVALFFSKEPKRFPWNGVTAVWILFILWVSITTYFAVDTPESLVALEKFFKVQFMIMLTLVLIVTRERLIALVWVIALSLGFYGIKGGLFAIRTGGEARVWGPEGSFISGNNEVGLALIMILPLFRFLQMQKVRPIIWWGLTGSMGLIALAILATRSRGAMLALVAMTFFIWLKSQQKMRVGLVLLIISPVMLMAMPQSWWDRMESLKNYEQDNSAMGRLTAWEFAIDMASNRFTGGGFNSFVEENYRRYSPNLTTEIMQRDGRFQGAHSIYFSVLGEHGFIGIILFLLLGILAFRVGSWVIVNTRGSPELIWANNLAAMVQVSIVGYAVGGAFLGLAYYDLYYNLIAILVLTKIIVQREINPDKNRVAIQPGLMSARGQKVGYMHD